jgi:hypothetical protein
MIYNWYHSLLKHYKENIDFNFSNSEKSYANINWLIGNKPSIEELQTLAIQDTNNFTIEEVRKQRNVLLQETDWRFRSDLNPSQEWKDYCQSLRDITNDSNNWSINDNGDITIQWPEKPV